MFFFFFGFCFCFFFLFNNPISSSIFKSSIRSEIYNCTFKNTNKVSVIIIIILKGYFRVNPILVFVVLKLKKVLLLMWSQQPNICKQESEFIYLTVFLSRIFINKVLPITKAVANDDDYPLKFYKAKSKLYRISLVPKRNSMFIRIIAVIDS